MRGVTLDTGALIGLERKKTRVLDALKAAKYRRLEITVPLVCVVEFWHGSRGPSAYVLSKMKKDSVIFESMTLPLAKVAGEALHSVRPGVSLTDAVVMASAASRGDIVLTSDIEDMQALQIFFPTVRLLAV